jgi:hypothetical protein
MIKSIRLLDCQSCKDVTYELATDRLNVIVAENDTGKSVLFKVLKLVGCPNYYSRRDREELIRHGAEFGMVLFEFTDASVAIMKIFRDRVIYAYQETKESPVISGIEPPEQMLAKMGMLSDVQGSFVANIIDADQDLLLVNPAISYNYDLIKMLVFNEDLDVLQERTDERLTESKTMLDRALDSMCFYEREIAANQYQDVEALENKQEFLTSVFNMMYSTMDVLDCLEEKFVDDVYRAMDFDKMIEIEELLEKLEIMQGSLGALGVVKEPCPIEVADVLGRLECLDDRIESLFVSVKEPVSIGTVDFLEELEKALERMSGLDTVSGEQDEKLRILNVLDAVESVVTRVASIDIAGVKEAEISVKDLEQQFENSGETVECPIYGKVVFDGKDCLADSV